MSLLGRIIVFIIMVFHAAHATQFLTLSDIHYGSENTSSDGQDTGPEFLKITLDKIKELNQHVDFILFLGDIPTHSLFNTHKEEYEKIVFHGLFQSDTSAKPLFYIAGNNDSLQGNYQAFSANNISPLTYASDWQGACAHCAGLMLDASQMKQYGYYSAYVMPNNQDIILIALNATQWTRIPWLKRTFFSKYDHQEHDARAQLAWLEQQLKKHHAKQLLIAVHEPPGNSYLGEPIWYEEYTQAFIKIISKYAAQYGQISLITSHTHMDEFRKIQLDNGSNVYAYSIPSISRNHHNYPGMKLFRFNQDYKIKDFTTYYTSFNQHWRNQQYHALSMPDAIFPNCQDKYLAQCLDGLSLKQVCADVDKGFFYGVKNPKVRYTSCPKTYLVK